MILFLCDTEAIGVRVILIMEYQNVNKMQYAPHIATKQSSNLPVNLEQQ